MLLTCGTYGNVIRLLPPLVIGDDLLDDALSLASTTVASGAWQHSDRHGPHCCEHPHRSVDRRCLRRRRRRRHFAVHDPATGDVLAHVADAGEKDALRALDSAAAAQDDWAATAPRTRSLILRTAWEKVIERKPRISRCS